MREEDLAYYVERFQHSGFTGPINWYRSMDASWEESRDDDNWQLTMPTLFIGGMQDPVIVFSQKALQRMPDYIPDLRTVMLDQCGQRDPDGAGGGSESDDWPLWRSRWQSLNKPAILPGGQPSPRLFPAGGVATGGAR